MMPRCFRYDMVTILPSFQNDSSALIKSTRTTRDRSIAPGPTSTCRTVRHSLQTFIISLMNMQLNCKKK